MSKQPKKRGYLKRPEVDMDGFRVPYELQGSLAIDTANTLGLAFVRSLDGMVERLAQRLPAPKQLACQRNFMCECGRRRCPGFTGSIKTYARKIKAVE